MNRRAFLSRAAETGAVAIAVGPLLAAPFIETKERYLATGFLKYDSPGAHRVDYITLDGVRVEHVIELNDVEGWLRHYADLDIRAAAGPDVVYRTGVVRVVYHPEVPA